MEEGKRTVDLNGEFRKLLSDELVVTRSLEDDCIYVFDDGEFEQWVNQLFEDSFGGYRSNNAKHVALRRKLKSRARDVQVDSAGRVMIAADQREAVGIEKDVVIVGNTGYFEVWDAKRYDAMDAEVDLSEMVARS